VCGTTRLRRQEGAVTRQSAIFPQMFLQTGLGRDSTRQLGQPPVGGDWGLSRYSRCPRRPTPISQNFSERFSKIQVYHTQKFRECVVSHTLFECFCKCNAPREPPVLGTPHKKKTCFPQNLPPALPPDLRNEPGLLDSPISGQQNKATHTHSGGPHERMGKAFSQVGDGGESLSLSDTP